MMRRALTWLALCLVVAGETAMAGEEAGDMRPAFGTLNYAVLAGYLALMLAVGFVAGKRIKSTASFFLADGRLNFVLVGVSLLGTYLSALTVMGLPGISYGEMNWAYAVQLPLLIFTAFVITRFVLRRYREAGILSVYEFLEQRIHVSARVIGSVSFIALAIGRMGVILYLPALAFHTVTGAPLVPCIVIMGVIITVYTVVGGMEAVVWTDAIQVVIFVVGALVTLAFIFGKLGIDTFLEVGRAHGKFALFRPGFDVTKITTVWLVLETIFQTIRIYGTQQAMVQRYMTTESVEKANRSVWISALAYIPLGVVFYLIGTALFVFYQVNPDPTLPARADSIYPHFVVTQLPPGVAGLLIAAIFAAAMSSIDSLMNSSAAVCVEDFVKRFGRRERSEDDYLRLARRLTIVWGVVAIGMALASMGTEYVQMLWGKVMAVSTNGLLGLMALAFLPFRIHKWAALTGFIVACACLVGMMVAGWNYLLWPVVGNTVCFVVALIVNAALPRVEEAPA